MSDWDAVVQAWRDVVGRPGRDAVIPGPAAAEAIAAAEARLGITMPVTLRSLYSIADGLPDLGLDMYGVRGCAELAWFRDAEPEFIAIWEEIDEEGYLAEIIELMRAGLAVSKGGDEYRLFFAPASATGGDGWELYQQSNGSNAVTGLQSLTKHLFGMVNVYFSPQA